MIGSLASSLWFNTLFIAPILKFERKIRSEVIDFQGYSRHLNHQLQYSVSNAL